jgi:hypothetical protein
MNTTARVSRWRELAQALRDGKMHFVLDGHITVEEPVDLSIHAPGSFYTFAGGGGWTSGAFYRGFDGPEPLFKAPRYGTDGRERHWEIRMSGCLFEALPDQYPNSGPALDFEILQLSWFHDVRFQSHNGNPFVFGRGENGVVNSTIFDRIYLEQNMEPGLLLNASDFEWRGGAIQQHRASYGTGLVIQGPPRDRPNSYPSPGYIERVHCEMSAIEVHGVDDMEFVPGYHYWSPVRLTDCGGDFNFRRGGTWKYSEAFRDGVRLPTHTI